MCATYKFYGTDSVSKFQMLIPMKANLRNPQQHFNNPKEKKKALEYLRNKTLFLL